MRPADPRHGTNRGYNAGCRQDCCRHAHMIYKKLWYMGRTRRYVDATGTRRRLEGLAALGYSMADISARLGMTRTYVYQLRKSTSVRDDNAAKVARVFDDLCMTTPNHPLAVRARRHAAKVGWLPPLAWDDIDNDPEPADSEPVPHTRDTYLDEVAIERALSGDRTVTLTVAEKRAATALWTRTGRSLSELEQVTGWKADRYVTREAA